MGRLPLDSVVEDIRDWFGTFSYCMNACPFLTIHWLVYKTISVHDYGLLGESVHGSTGGSRPFHTMVEGNLTCRGSRVSGGLYRGRHHQEFRRANAVKDEAVD
ncbi:hypothetical protein V6N11_029423 [Hibiscus sabdariffa]|uniref:Uncharacterized protein n=1 Tax=Hibiscus sabdariffa TaxID=183260 RepID=A0ABR2P6L5_9ROSI